LLEKAHYEQLSSVAIFEKSPRPHRSTGERVWRGVWLGLSMDIFHQMHWGKC